MADRPPPGTDARPLRVVVLGSSTAFMVVPKPTSSDEAPYGALLDEALRRRGVVSRTDVHTQWHATVREVLPRFESWVRDHFPDVVVVNLGINDCQARVLPTWLYRHLITWSPGLSKASVAYRERVVPTLRRRAREYQRWAAPRVPLQGSRVRPVVFERAVLRLLRWCVRDLGAQVLVLDIDAPGPQLRHWQPGIEDRVTAYNELLRRAVSRQQGAHLVRTSAVVAADPDALLPDGLHRSAAGHRLVAEAVAEAITALPRLAP